MLALNFYKYLFLFDVYTSLCLQECVCTTSLPGAKQPRLAFLSCLASWDYRSTQKPLLTTDDPGYQN